MVNPGDYLPSDEDIDVEMLDSDTELSKVVAAPRKSPVSYDSDSDFEALPAKRKPAASKRGGRGRGRGRGRGGATRSTAKAAAAATPTEGSEIEGEDAFDAPAPKARRGRPRKVVDDSEKPKPKRGRKKAVANEDEDNFEAPVAKGKARQMTLDEIDATPKVLTFDPVHNAELAQTYPDPYWKELLSEPTDGGRIDLIDEDHPLELLPYTMTDQMALTGMALSPDGTMLATFGSSGNVHIWDTDTFACLVTLRDRAEPNIDEFFVGQFTPNSEYLVVGGKLKDRKRWSEADEDNHILACPLKIFNVVTGEVVARLDGHSEEILCVKGVVYKGENYFVTTSQDGYIRRWHMDSSWVVLKDSTEIADGITCMVFTVSFIPNTGNRYFIASTDDHLTLMDLERCRIVQRFDPIYSSYCDCGKFIELLEQPVYQALRPSIAAADVADTDEGCAIKSEDSVAASTMAAAQQPPEPSGLHAYFVTRGVELLDAENNTVSSRPNTCTLHRLVYPTEPDGKFVLQEIRRYHHDEYMSNSWLIRIASNGRYILAPTLNGQVFVFNIATGQVTGILRDHDTIEVRDCKFHPTKNLLFTCSDDGTVKVYRSTTRPAQAVATTSGVAMEGVVTDEQVEDPESPKTAAVSPLALIKDGIETMAVGEIAPVSAEPASAIQQSDDVMSAE
ncbi:hypothetical protein IW136_003626 [Coemansia sp. RSA 678]|nr:hypothetical protein IW136_003626 [Coemansia sp. RSA 678]